MNGWALLAAACAIGTATASFAYRKRNPRWSDTLAAAAIGCVALWGLIEATT